MLPVVSATNIFPEIIRVSLLVGYFSHKPPLNLPTLFDFLLKSDSELSTSIFQGPYFIFSHLFFT